MKKNYVLIDYENVQPASIEALEHEQFHVIVFVGANQTKVTYEVASALQRMGSRASYLKVSGNGSNALDFHIAFYIGQLSTKEPEAYFHVVSKDTGFDPLIQHLKGLKIPASRVRAITDLPLVKAATSTNMEERAAAVLANLTQRGSAKPRTLKTLGSTINALFQKSLSDAEIEHIIGNLKKKGVIAINDAKVTYVAASGQ